MEIDRLVEFLGKIEFNNFGSVGLWFKYNYAQHNYDSNGNCYSYDINLSSFYKDNFYN